MTPSEGWHRFQRYLCCCPSIGLSVDPSRMIFDEAYLRRMEPVIQSAFSAMSRLEAGEISNPDEQRMVGHYWLRASHLAPSPSIRDEIETTVKRIKAFAGGIHLGEIRSGGGRPFTELLLIGIGGSALGPMFVSDALGDPNKDRMRFWIFDNTDPGGMHRELSRIGQRLNQTLCVVISKSGTTPETRNGLVIARQAFESMGMDFTRHAVAVTGTESKLDQQSRSEQWLGRFPMWDWVGGRTSETSAVGLLPAALQGLDIDALLAGAAACDEVTRERNTRANPAAWLAMMWYAATEGRGAKDMVVLPYQDRLLLFSRYLQQLVMESLGKRLDLAGRRVDQGLTVYGNKGSTDQHAYVQQLRDGVNNFFVTFIRVLESGSSPVEVEPGITAGDYLHGFLMGTRQALADHQRQSMTITIQRVDAFHTGVLLALFERAVGLYAHLIGINAYHQPGVEAGKKAAAGVLELQSMVRVRLREDAQTAEQMATELGRPDEAEAVFWILEHLSANGRARREGALSPGSAKFRRA